ncbi:helix-turn-helix domain-containing protein [Sphingomonas sp. CROZ-RG-20F-R02-07]|uniref:MmyB family transcriptional regulator n=1 Tax=Sphingomonas sp. CROZ-RG-20F-R02-07 TaxID=2914832 RepID=UPI001F5ACFD4
MSGNKPLGDFLRSRRYRLDPVALGLSGTRRRRTPGLRREEVADRARISCEWYVKLEQGRPVSASAGTIAALARALALDAAETAHLHKLAARSSAEAFGQETVPEIINTIVKSLPEPAYVTGLRWDVLAWNAAADELFGFTSMDQRERNILRYMLTTPDARAMFGRDWAQEAERMIALFRPTYDQRAGDPAFEELVLALSEACDEFRGWWCSHLVASPSAGTKTLHSSGRDGATYVYASFQANDDPALKLALYTRRHGMP